MKRLLLFLLLIPSFVSGQSFLMSVSNNRKAVLTELINDDIQGVSRNQAQYSANFGTAIGLGTTAEALDNDISYSNVTGATITMQFWGFRIDWISEKYVSHGIIGVSIDGGAETLVDQYLSAASPLTQQVLFASPILTQGLHTIRLRVTGTKNAASSNTYVVHDYFKVYTDGSTPPDEPLPSLPNTRYVDQATGSDSNPCTNAARCATIQRGFNIAAAGDDILVFDGTYRETIIPPISGTSTAPITVKAAPGQTPLVSGLNVVNTIWTPHSGNIYKTTITLPTLGLAVTGKHLTSNTTLFDHQLFKDGEMQIQARWPNGVTDYTKLQDLTVGSGTDQAGTRRHISNFGTSGTTSFPFRHNFLQDNALLSAPINGGTSMNGADMITQGWYISEWRTVTHSGNQLNYSSIWNTGTPDLSDPGTHIRRYYFLTGKLILLDQQREFHYEGGTLYYWQPGGGAPTGVEYKARNWGFDLRGRDYITIEGISFKGCEPATGDESTDNCTLDNIRASHQNHLVRHQRGAWQGHGMMQLVGVKLLGTGNVIKNSEFKWTASQAVWLSNNGRVENNLFEYIGYDGMWGCPVAFWGIDAGGNVTNANNNVITKNTMRHLQRGGVDNGNGFWEGSLNGFSNEIIRSNTVNNEISYNDIWDFSKINQDGGAFYSAGWQNLGGLNIHHNWIHDIGAVPSPDPLYNGTRSDGIMAGIYFDMGSGADPGYAQVKIHHNVFSRIPFNPTSPFSNTEMADIYTLPYFQVGMTTNRIGKQKTLIYNNTMDGGSKVYVTYQGNVVDVVRNNIHRYEYNNNWGAAGTDIANTLSSGTNPNFVGGTLTPYPNTPYSTYYQLTTGTAVNGGVVIPGITDGYEGAAPDMGAYEKNVTPWVPGYVPIP